MYFKWFARKHFWNTIKARRIKCKWRTGTWLVAVYYSFTRHPSPSIPPPIYSPLHPHLYAACKQVGKHCARTCQIYNAHMTCPKSQDLSMMTYNTNFLTLLLYIRSEVPTINSIHAKNNSFASVGSVSFRIIVFVLVKGLGIWLRNNYFVSITIIVTMLRCDQKYGPQTAGKNERTLKIGRWDWNPMN